MKLTKKQRNEAYNWVINLPITSYTLNDGICIFLDAWVKNKGVYTNKFEETVDMFDEFKLFKPHDFVRSWDTWFDDGNDGFEQRLTCLAFCIAMTED